MSPEKSTPETFGPEPRQVFSFRHESLVPGYGDDEKDDKSAEAGSPEPRRLSLVHEFHSTLYAADRF